MKHAFRRYGIQPGYGLRAGLMFSYIFLIIATLLIVKPVRTSLFLTQFGAGQLPYVFILVAITSALTATGYFKLSGIISLHRLVALSLVFSVVCFLAAWGLLFAGYQASWFVYAFYVWVAIFGVISTSQFWLLANYVFNAREAKKIFGFLGAGAIAGGIFGGYLTNFLVSTVGTQNIILIGVGFLLVNLGSLRVIWTRYARRNYQEITASRRRGLRTVTTERPFKLILSSKHMTYLAALTGVGVLVASLVDFQFNSIASSIIRDEDALTAFLGFWYSNFSLAALGIQFFITGPVLRKLGVTPSLYLLPGGIFIGAVAILFAPMLGTAILIRLLEGGFKQSINKAGLELLALPIPSAIKNRTKTFMDMLVPNTAEGVGGVVLIVLTVILGISPRYISLFMILCLVLWMIIIHLVKREYVDSFRQAIEKRTVNLEELTVNVNDATVRQILEKVLQSDNPRQVLYVLRILDETAPESLSPYLEKLIEHPAKEVKAQVLRMAAGQEAFDFSTQAAELVEVEHEELRVAAIDYLCRRTSDPVEKLAQFLRHDDIQVQIAAGIAAAQYYREFPQIQKGMDTAQIYRDSVEHTDKMDLSDEQREHLRFHRAEIIGLGSVEALYPYLHEFLHDPSPRVQRSAVTAAGRTRAPEFIESLIEHLNTKVVRSYARSALAEYGDEAVPELAEKLSDPEGSNQVKRGIIKVLALIGTRKATRVLVDNLDQEDVEQRHTIIKALNKIHDLQPEIKFDSRKIEALIKKEIEARNGLLEVLQEHRQKAVEERRIPGEGAYHAAQKLLEKAIKERLAANLERIFRLLGLRYNQYEIYNAYLGILSDNAVLRANALEFLDNLLDFHLKQLVMPMLESSETIVTGRRVPPWHRREAQHEEAHYLTRLLRASDAWLNACALFFIAHYGDSSWTERIERRARSKIGIVRETAEYAVNQLKNPV